MFELIMVGQCFKDPKKKERTRLVMQRFAPDVVCVEGTRSLHDLILTAAQGLSEFLASDLVQGHPEREDMFAVFDNAFGGYGSMLDYTDLGYPLYFVDNPDNEIVRLNETELKKTIDHCSRCSKADQLDNLLRQAKELRESRDCYEAYSKSKYDLYRRCSASPLLQSYHKIMNLDNVSRDSYMERQLRRIREENLTSTILWIGNISRICEDADGLTLYSRLVDLEPSRVALDEIESMNKLD